MAMAQVSLSASGPASWLFYIVASVGQKGSYRPLAVTVVEREDGARESQTMRGSNLINTCLQITAILSDEANRLAIQGELRLAEEFYNSKHNMPRAELWEPDADALPWDRPDRDWDRSQREFPFLSSCLLVGTGYDPSTGALYNVRTEPLGTAYRGNSLEYGMVVFDISDLDKIRYGIVGFFVHLMAEVEARLADRDGGYDPIEDVPPELDPVPVVEADRPRVPLSVSAYMAKFHYHPYHLVQRLERLSLVDARVLDFIWPIYSPNLNPDLDPDLVDVDTIEPPQDSTRPLRDQAIVSLIESTQDRERDSFDMSIFDHVLLLPSFPSSLLRLMEAHPDRLGPTRSAGQLLKLAYAGRTHLDWASYKHLSADVIAAAIESPELAGAESLVFRLGPNCGKTAELVRTLPLLEGLQQLCVLQEPIRTDDDLSAELFAQLSAAAAADPGARRLLQTTRVIFTGAHSAALRKSFWLPSTATNYRQAVEAFPVQQIFVRHQFETPVNATASNFWPNYFYLGDMPLSPQHFAAGFLRFLRSTYSDEHLLAFASAPPDLESMSLCRAAVSPLPAEVFSIPLQPFAVPFSHQQRDCWSKARDLVAGGWTVLVSEECYRDDAAAARNALDYHSRPTVARFIRYAFVRARDGVTFSELSAREIREELDLGPDKIDVVGGLYEFLQATAGPGVVVDAALVQRRLDELVRDLVERPTHSPAAWERGQASLGAGMKWLSVLERDEACDMLRDFFEDAAFVRRNLRLSMEEDPTGRSGRNWYPELLGGGGNNELESRNHEVFRSLR